MTDSPNPQRHRRADRGRAPPRRNARHGPRAPGAARAADAGLGRVGQGQDKGADIAEDAVDAVKARPVAVGGVAAALGLFLAREPDQGRGGQIIRRHDVTTRATKTPRPALKHITSAGPAAPRDARHARLAQDGDRAMSDKQTDRHRRQARSRRRTPPTPRSATAPATSMTARAPPRSTPMTARARKPSAGRRRSRRRDRRSAVDRACRRARGRRAARRLAPAHRAGGQIARPDRREASPAARATRSKPPRKPAARS